VFSVGRIAGQLKKVHSLFFFPLKSIGWLSLLNVARIIASGKEEGVSGSISVKNFLVRRVLSQVLITCMQELFLSKSRGLILY